MDSTFIRSCEDGKRHLEVWIGNVETTTGRRQVFGAVAKIDTELAALIRGNLDAAGRTKNTAVTAFTDGCPGLRRILLGVGITELPILDWFHLAMRLQHLTQATGSLSSDTPERAATKAVIVEEVERLSRTSVYVSPLLRSTAARRRSCSSGVSLSATRKRKGRVIAGRSSLGWKSAAAAGATVAPAKGGPLFVIGAAVGGRTRQHGGVWLPLWATRRALARSQHEDLLLSHAEASAAIAALLLARGHEVAFCGGGAVHDALLDALDGYDGCLLLGRAPEFAAFAAAFRDRRKAVWRAWTDILPVAAPPPWGGEVTPHVISCATRLG